MFKLVVFAVLVAFAVAGPKPGYLGVQPWAYTSHHVLPLAVSHSARVDVVPNPVIALSSPTLLTSYGLWNGYGLHDGWW